MILQEHNNAGSGNIINGLVLAGGKSVRMGKDKARIVWHNKEQHYHMADLLNQFCNKVFISCRLEQESKIDINYNVLPDTVTNLGPYGAILSAFENNAECAWLVTACDLPLLDESTIEYLVQHRDQSCIATTYRSPYDGMPEPLITIWEPHSYKVLLSFLTLGISCPRKALINSDVCILTPPDPRALSNVNTPEEVFETMNTIKQMKHNA